MAPPPKYKINIKANLPEWLKDMSLENALQMHVGDEYDKVLELNVDEISKEGENYSSLVLRIKAKVQLKDQSQKSVSFILKTSQSNEIMAKMLNLFNIFPKEEEIYHKILPRFEQMYRDIGKYIKFAPKAFKFDRDMDQDYILLEDLCTKNYKNANRIQGLELGHMQETLRKLAEYHAASACYVEKYGSFGADFTLSVFNPKNREILQQFNNSMAFLNQLKNWKNCTKFYEKLMESDKYLVDRLLEDQTVNPGEFNVLNHGDCWSNNIMYQYDAFGKIKNVRFVDFALGKYGSPANDLYYLILSSSLAEIKLQQFDFFIRYYYEHLKDNLKLLEYSRPLPKLTAIHCQLLRNGLSAYMVVSKVLPAVILDNSDKANLENFIKNQSQMLSSMYKNPKYIKEMMDILPWLNNKGLLDWK